VTASRFLNVRTPKIESRASRAIENLEVARVLKNKANNLGGGKSAFEKVRNCAVCNLCVTRKKHECFKPFCTNCRQNMEINHLCYMQPLKNELPSSDDVLFVFYDFETTQDTKFNESATLRVPMLV